MVSVLDMDSVLTPRQDVVSLFDEVRALKNRIPEDVTVRRQLSNAIHELSLALETPLETVRRISFSVKVIHTLTDDHSTEYQIATSNNDRKGRQ